MKTKTTKRTIWTWGYRPFVMGGNVNYVLGVEMWCYGPYVLGKGHKGYVAVAPNGKCFVAEATTGAIVGNGETEKLALEKVRGDIKTGNSKVMKQQVKEAKEQIKDIEIHAPSFFWKAMKCI